MPDKSVPSKKRGHKTFTIENIQSLLAHSDQEIVAYMRRLGTQGGTPRLISPTAILDLRACGCSEEEIAGKLGVTRKTLQRLIKRDPLVRAMFDLGDSHGRANLRSRQHVKAMQGDTTMLIWLGKQRLGQRDVHDLAGVDKNGDRAPLLDVDGFRKLVAAAVKVSETAEE